MLSRRVVVTTTVLTVLFGGGCTPDESTEAEPPRGDPSPASSGTSAGVEDHPDSPEPVRVAGCTSGDAAGGDDGDERLLEEGDFDGDGRTDQLLRGADMRVRVAFAAGGSSAVEVPTAKPFGVIGTQDVQRDGREEAFIEILQGGADGRPGVFVASVVRCDFRLLQDAQRDPYMFIVGEAGDAGDGVGCVDGHLVGLHYERRGDKVAWERTAVHVQDGQLENGAKMTGVFTSPQDDERIRLLSEATCYDDPLDNEYA